MRPEIEFIKVTPAVKLGAPTEIWGCNSINSFQVEIGWNIFGIFYKRVTLLLLVQKKKKNVE